jgi:hypothetical protein
MSRDVSGRAALLETHRTMRPAMRGHTMIGKVRNKPRRTRVEGSRNLLGPAHRWDRGEGETAGGEAGAGCLQETAEYAAGAAAIADLVVPIIDLLLRLARIHIRQTSGKKTGIRMFRPKKVPCSNKRKPKLNAFVKHSTGYCVTSKMSASN